MMRNVRSAVAIALVLAAGTPRPAAAEDPKSACYSAFEDAQVRRKGGQLRSAMEALRTCTRDVCPAVVRGDCLQWLEQVEQQVPTVVFEAETDDGDAPDAVATMDGVPIASRLEGRAVPVDPGEHEFVIGWRGRTQTKRMIIKEGEKSRVVVADFRSERKSSPPMPPNPTRKHRPVPTAAWVLGGVGLVGAAGFVTFGSVGNGQRDDLTAKCAPFCSTDDTRAARASYMIADISMGLGGAALVTAGILYFTRPEVEVSDLPAGDKHALHPAWRRLTPVAVATPTSASLGIVGRF